MGEGKNGGGMGEDALFSSSSTFIFFFASSPPWRLGVISSSPAFRDPPASPNKAPHPWWYGSPARMALAR